MRANTLRLDRSTTPATLEFAPDFNVAVPFIDRHIEQGRADKVAIRGDFGDITYDALVRQVNRCGNALGGLGIDAPDRVLMVVKDCPEFFYLFWGAIKAGLIPVPLNTLLRADDYAYMIEDSECRALVYSPEFAAEIEPALAAAGHKPAYVHTTEGEGSIAALMEGAKDSLDAAPAAPDDDCFWLYSSGSTGRPKGVVHSHRDIPLTCEYYAVGILGIGEDDVNFSAAKLFFAYGLGNAMTFPLWVGGCAVLSPARPSPDMTFEMIETYRPTVFYGVPTLYAAQLKAMETATPDLGSVRCYVSAGEALPPDLFRRWREKTGKTILDGIGSTELLHIFLSNTVDDHKPGTTGREVPGYEARVLGEDGATVTPGEPGKLMIKGASALTRYWNKPEKTAATIIGEWVATGDTYTQDEDGYFVYCGRDDDMLKVGGIWCSPFEIEARLVEHPKVLEAAIVGRSDENDLIKPEAFIVLNDAAVAVDGLADELLAHCKEGLAPYKYPRWFNFVDDLPKTATGKIQRFKLRAG
jgi:benzoate-CoA ligase family protein